MLFFKVLNKSTNKVEVVTKSVKDIIEKNHAYKSKYEIQSECDELGRELNYNNFLNSKPNEPIESIRIEQAGSGTEIKEETAIEPKPIAEPIGNGNDAVDSGNTKGKPDIKPNKRKKDK